MQSKKTKRLYDTKSEKEKQMREDEERKKKLAELYRKQRSQQQAGGSGMAAGGASAGRPVKMSGKNDSNSSNEYHELANSTGSVKAGSGVVAKTNKLYEQDMSKILLDKITHLLNDNDKLVEKQRKQLHQCKTAAAATQQKMRRVDFAVGIKYNLLENITCFLKISDVITSKFTKVIKSIKKLF